MKGSSGSLPVFALTAMVVGSMVGAGIFSLPRSFGAATGVVGAILAWSITGLGMYALARVFQQLAEARPQLDAGVYSYAREGFGGYAGFLAGAGYWLVGCIADVSYWVLIKSTLGAVFPIFGDGNTIAAVAISSIGLWLYHVLILQGVRQAATLNTVVTVAKIVPILVFIALVAFAFRPDVFLANLWGGGGEAGSAPGLLDQVRSTLLVTIFVFIGIEGASVYSRYARRRSDVGRATVIGFLLVLALMVAVTLLPYAALSGADLAGLRQPSMATALERIVGSWGGIFVSIGLIISVLGAYLAWSLIALEVLFALAKAGDMPRLLARENRKGVPAPALWLSNIVIQLVLIVTLFSDDAFTTLVKLTSTMVLVPYLLSAFFAVKVTVADGGLSPGRLFWPGLASVFAALMIVAAGVQFLLLSALLYAPATALYAWARREQGRGVFTRAEWIVFALLILAALLGAYGLATGAIVI